MARSLTDELPAQAQWIDQKALNVIPNVLPPIELNGSSIWIPEGATAEALKEKPFHVYDEEFLAVIGPNPTLTLLARTDTDPIFHEAVVWYPPTDEVFVCQNAGAKAAGTGLNKSATIAKISLKQADAVTELRNASGKVDVITIPHTQVVNPNGATNYKGNLVYMAEGQGPNIASELILMNPLEPYNTTVLLNNYFGRAFNSLNDGVVNPRNGDIYFTDVTYGYMQDFRPLPGMPNQVYRYNGDTGAVTVVADQLVLPNGICFSPSANYLYVTDGGAQRAFYGYNSSAVSSIYRYEVQEDGTLENRKLFTYVHTGIPDGVHTDSAGNVYSSVGDGVHVWNPSGKLIGKIYLGEGSANFRFAGKGRMVIGAETNLFYARIKASGSDFIEL
ncbi:gluconolactonase [Cadophora sp. DSE1049]|nr:gluconolactonase [Cadophora sp. DSE1049]